MLLEDNAEAVKEDGADGAQLNPDKTSMQPCTLLLVILAPAALALVIMPCTLLSVMLPMQVNSLLQTSIMPCTLLLGKLGAILIFSRYMKLGLAGQVILLKFALAGKSRNACM
jgi:hypothetical protein